MKITHGVHEIAHKAGRSARGGRRPDKSKSTVLRLRRALRTTIDKGCSLLIGDLVTFGSPLANAEVLLAKKRADLEAREAARELPPVTHVFLPSHRLMALIRNIKSIT